MASVFGLLGQNLAHSFSKDWFGKKFNTLGLKEYSYQNFELNSINEFKDLLQKNPSLKGLNVTLPFKESILEFLDEINAEAKTIGAVNCIRILNGKTKGYNTDVYGFSQSIKPFLDFNHQGALILGTGGAAKAVNYALKKIGVETLFVSSSKNKLTKEIIHYSDLNAIAFQSYKLIVNCTPLGMFPESNVLPPLPYDFFSPEHLAYDLIYNPEETLFLKKAKEKGAIVVNGLSMLQQQAEKVG